LKSAWRVIEPYWRSKSNWAGYLLLTGIIVGAIASTYFQLGLTKYAGATMDALAKHDSRAYWRLLPGYFGTIGGTVAIALLSLFAKSALQIIWRTWMTERYLSRWFGHDTLYRIERERLIDNPDQRITEDIDQMITNGFLLAFGLIATLMQMGAFTEQLWTLGGALQFKAVGREWVLPGYMVWIAVAYAIVTTGLSHWMGRPLMRLTFAQQRYEAGFRFMMVGVREYAEQIALYHGAATEIRRMRSAFEAVRLNFWQLLRVNIAFTGMSTFWTLLGALVPITAAAQRYFAGQISLGEIMRIVTAFEVVMVSLTWFVQNYATIQLFRVVVGRLHGLELASEVGEPGNGDIDRVESSASALTVVDLVLRSPQGIALNDNISWTVRPGERWLVRGASGVGKSTLMRAVSGIWPYGQGRIDIPRGASTLFLSQRNYLPSGSLKGALCYPSQEERFGDELCRQILEDVRLGAYSGRLHEDDRWGQRLSPGEQQRVALGRVLLQKPDYLFLDESTSALDQSTEQVLLSLLIQRLPETAIVFVTHRPAPEDFHSRVLAVKPAASRESAAA
jgi:vitamin B12/bleomycin/antimicrobial peptide transport system ATP-binding/permease protein